MLRIAVLIATFLHVFASFSHCTFIQVRLERPNSYADSFLNFLAIAEKSGESLNAMVARCAICHEPIGDRSKILVFQREKLDFSNGLMGEAQKYTRIAHQGCTVDKRSFFTPQKNVCACCHKPETCADAVLCDPNSPFSSWREFWEAVCVYQQLDSSIHLFKYFGVKMKQNFVFSLADCQNTAVSTLQLYLDATQFTKKIIRKDKRDALYLLFRNMLQYSRNADDVRRLLDHVIAAKQFDIFLDAIADLPLETQPKTSMQIEEKQFLNPKAVLELFYTIFAFHYQKNIEKASFIESYYIDFETLKKLAILSINHQVANTHLVAAFFVLVLDVFGLQQLQVYFAEDFSYAAHLKQLQTYELRVYFLHIACIYRNSRLIHMEGSELFTAALSLFHKAGVELAGSSLKIFDSRPEVLQFVGACMHLLQHVQRVTIVDEALNGPLLKQLARQLDCFPLLRHLTLHYSDADRFGEFWTAFENVNFVESVEIFGKFHTPLDDVNVVFVLKRMKKLASLRFCGLLLSSDFTAVLVRLLPTRKNLSAFALADVRFEGGRRIGHLLDCLCETPKLRYVDVRGSGFTDADALSLAAALRHWPLLAHFFVSGQVARSDSLTIVAQALEAKQLFVHIAMGPGDCFSISVGDEGAANFEHGMSDGDAAKENLEAYDALNTSRIDLRIRPILRSRYPSNE